MLNVPDWVHNHPPDIPLGGYASCPPTKGIQAAVSAIASSTSIGHSEISTLLQEHPEYDQKHPLEAHQISDIVNVARRTARNKVLALGGDVNAIVTWLRAR